MGVMLLLMVNNMAVHQAILNGHKMDAQAGSPVCKLNNYSMSTMLIIP